MTPPDRLCQHRADVDDIDLVRQLELLVLRDRVGNDHPLHSRVLDDLKERAKPSGTISISFDTNPTRNHSVEEVGKLTWIAFPLRIP
jgi:hypothetical protein